MGNGLRSFAGSIYNSNHSYSKKRITYFIGIFDMFSGQNSLIFGIYPKEFLAFLICREDQSDCRIVNFFKSYKSGEELVSNLETGRLCSIQDEFRAIDFKAFSEIGINLKRGRLGIYFLDGTETELSVISIVEEFLDSFLDSGNFFFVSALQEFLGHFCLDVEQ